jgi:putative endonuclease
MNTPIKSYAIYIIECINGNYYTGYTTDLARRYTEHLTGSNKCKYTKANPPKQLAASWKLDATLSEIFRIEYAIKQLSKTDKSKLIKHPELFAEILLKLNINAYK